MGWKFPKAQREFKVKPVKETFDVICLIIDEKKIFEANFS